VADELVGRIYLMKADRELWTLDDQAVDAAARP
jgi:hypothetical protein